MVVQACGGWIEVWLKFLLQWCDEMRLRAETEAGAERLAQVIYLLLRLEMG